MRRDPRRFYDRHEDRGANAGRCHATAMAYEVMPREGETGSGGDVTSSCFGGAGMRVMFATRARASE